MSTMSVAMRGTGPCGRLAAPAPSANHPGFLATSAAGSSWKDGRIPRPLFPGAMPPS